MASSRRIGEESSETRALLLDAAEQMMKDEGYPAVTSRRLAKRVGVSNQLVHYYFRTMDELFLALMRRGAERNVQLQMQALASENPLRALWEFNSDPEAVKLAMEFMALTNHRKDIGKEILRHAEQLRSLQIEALASALSRYGVDPNVFPPVCLSILMASVPRTMAMEAAVGISLGHAETAALVDNYLRQLESPAKTRTGAPSRPQRKRALIKPRRAPAGKQRR
jgi:AcrR family transcriptional regulator